LFYALNQFNERFFILGGLPLINLYFHKVIEFPRRLIMAIPWQLHIVIIMNRKAGINLLVHAATEAIQQWARDVKGMRMGI
jgi:hypothetical protein